MSKRIKVLVPIPAFQDLESLQSVIKRLDALGVDGVIMPDHIFISHGRPRREADRPHEALTALAVAGAIAPRLTLGTMVCNISLRDPIGLFRQFAQLAQLFGGGRVLAGIGAGWNPEEFDAVGSAMPSYAVRMERLEEALQIGRALFDEGGATFAGAHFTTRDLPLTPKPTHPPQLMVGGGSDRLLTLAGRYADALDLGGSSKRTHLRGAHPYNLDLRRRLSTTLEDLERSIDIVGTSAEEAGRTRDSVSLSLAILNAKFGSHSEVQGWERDLCARVGLDPFPLADCPYVMAGRPASVAERLRERIDRLGIQAVIVSSGPELNVFLEQVLPII